jgi:tetratricopeptide (TPR) repeat protein
MIRRSKRFALVAAAVAVLGIDAAAAAGSIRDTYAEHTRAVELGRAGRYDEGLGILGALLAQFPNDYPLQRDYIILTARKGDCERALERFERVRAEPKLDDYLVRELADCGVKQARSGVFERGIPVLARLLEVFPDDYRLQRDYIVINVWKGDCERALERFERVRNEPALEEYLVRAVADCAVRRAREGDYDGGIDVLEALLPHASDRYPLERDILVLTAWNGQCPEALERFERIRWELRYEPYLVLAVSDCQLEAGRRTEAAALLTEALERHPQEPRLHFAWLKANVALRIDNRYDDDRHAVEFETGSNQDDAGLLEWRSRLEASTRVAPRTRVYARYSATRSDDRQFDAGNLHRAGIGVRYRFNPQWRIDQEFSTDVRNSGQGGSATELIFEPRDTWQLAAGYTTFAEDIPLRARATGVESDRAYGAVEYNSLDYVWYGRVTVNTYDFTDDNQRDSFYAVGGYAFEMLPYREQRVYLEWYQSRNTREDAPYFNPSRDRSPGVVHRTDFVFDSRYKRHVDSLFLNISAYDQAGFDTKVRWGVRYEQDYDFDDFTSLNWGVGFGHNYYDGEGENALNAALRFVWRF